MKLAVPFGLFALLPALLLAEISDPVEDSPDEGNGPMLRRQLQLGEINVEPIQLPKDDEHLQRAFQARHTKWVEALLLADFSKRNAGAPWLGAATAVLREAAPYLSGEKYDNPLTGASTYPPAPLVQQAKAARSAGCDDPLFNVIVPFLETYSRPRTPEQMDMAERRLPDLLESGESPYLKFFACSWIWGGRFDHRATRNDAKRIAIEKEIPLQLGAALDASVTPEDSLGFYQFLRRNHCYMLSYMKRKETEALAIVGKSKAAPWLKNTILGEFEIDAAWRARGKGYADTVTEEGWKGFEEHLNNARDLLSTAWKENPAVPFAAEKMIVVTMGGSPAKGIDERGWFDRATAACFDHLPAYDDLLWAYRPRWGGSHALMISFGKACARTRRYDTFVPARLSKAVGAVGSELLDHRAVLDDPEIGRLSVETERGMMPYSKTEEDKHYSLSFGTCNAFLARDYPLAASYYKALKQPMLAAAVTALESYGYQEIEWRGILAVEDDPAAAKVLPEAEQAYRTGDLAAARPLYQSLVRLSSVTSRPDAEKLVRLRLAAIDVEQRFAKGDWVRLSDEEHQWIWINDSVAQWQKLSGGVLSVRNEKNLAFSRVFLGARVGLDFEVRVRLDNAKDLATSQFGGVIAYWPGHQGLVTVVCGRTNKANAKGAAVVAMSYDTTDRDPPVPLELKHDSLIRIVSRNGKITLWVDEKEILTRTLDDYFKRRSPSQEPGKEQHFFGFGTRLFPQGESRLKDFEFRKLSAK